MQIIAISFKFNVSFLKQFFELRVKFFVLKVHVYINENDFLENLNILPFLFCLLCRTCNEEKIFIFLET